MLYIYFYGNYFLGDIIDMFRFSLTSKIQMI